jgi:hypothetical protein
VVRDLVDSGDVPQISPSVNYRDKPL